jgi:hypothetical protein
MKTILQSVFVCIVLLLGYQVLLKYQELKKLETFQSWWQENEIKAQNYVYSKEKYSKVLVGTSLSANLILNKNKPFIYNLSFIGGGSLTGLEIIKKSNKLPDTLIIEMNWIDRNIDDGLINKLFNPIGRTIKQNISALQEENQPVNYLSNILAQNFNIEKINTELNLDPIRFDKAVKESAYSDNQVDSLNLTNYLKQIKNYASYFKQKEVKVFYLIIPVHPLIAQSKKYSIVRNFLSPQEDEVISKLGNQSLITTDGYHFTKESAIIYSNQLKNRLQ